MTLLTALDPAETTEAGEETCFGCNGRGFLPASFATCGWCDGDGVLTHQHAERIRSLDA